jgi:hypothetical protein
MIDGAVMTINGQEYVIPALNFKALRKLRADLDMLGKVESNRPLTDDEADAFVRVFHAALVRNYPDMTTDDVEELVDFRNLVPLMTAIMGASGFVAGGAAAGSGQTLTSSTAT